MVKLKHAIETEDVFVSALNVAKLLGNISHQECESIHVELEHWVRAFRQKHPQHSLNHESFSNLLDFFYRDLAFSGDEQHFFSSKYSLINQVMAYRTGIPISLAIVLQALARSLGFTVFGINFPGHFILCYQHPSQGKYYLDPNNGKRLSLAELDTLYFAILDQMENESMPAEALQPATCSETVVRLLHNLKSSFINEKRYQQALATVEILVGLCPEDPYERRDRGFLLHQLDCSQVAIADYEYFIRHCPKDPAIQLLEAQVRQLTEHPPQVLH